MIEIVGKCWKKRDWYITSQGHFKNPLCSLSQKCLLQGQACALCFLTTISEKRTWSAKMNRRAEKGPRGKKINCREYERKRENQSNRVKNVLICRHGLDVSRDTNENLSRKTNCLVAVVLLSLCPSLSLFPLFLGKLCVCVFGYAPTHTCAFAQHPVMHLVVWQLSSTGAITS